MVTGAENIGATMPTLTIRLFGGADFADGDRPISLVALPKSLPLLGYLLLHAGRAVPRDRLAYALWPDETEGDARSNLRRHLYRLVRALPPASPGGPWILTDAKTVRWNIGSSFACDVVSFEALSADPSTRDAAAVLYTGEVLTGLDEPWLPAERERLRALQDVNLAHAIATNHERRDYPAAIAFAQMRLTLDPFDERSVRTLMTLRSEAGDRAGALAEYERFGETLYAELGARPMPETSALCDRISVGEALASDPATVPTQERASDRLPFVGRDRDLGELETAWSAAARGRGGAVLIGGEAGIGKSRLVGEFARVVEAQGGSVFFGTTAPEETRPYQAVAEALRDALPVLLDADIEPLWLSTLASLVPEIAARRPELDLPPALDERKERARLFEAVARAIEACARTRPRLIVLEDLHWASGATLELVEYLARRSSSMRALFALTARDDLARTHPLQRILRDLTRAEIARMIPLRPLSRDDVMTLLSRRGEVDAQAATAAEWLYARTEGNPLFLRLALGSEAADAFDGGIDTVIATRFAGVSEDARALAEAAAIVGQGFDVEIVREVCGWTQAAVHDALDELIDRQMIREATVSQHTDYAFSHHLLWVHVYGAIPADRRARGHRRAARALDDVAADRPELARLVARHYDAADIPDRAALYYGRAAEHAARLCANDDAIAAATRAFELAEDPRTRLDVVALREELHARTGARAEQDEDLRLMAELADLVDEPNVRCEMWRRRAARAHARGDSASEAEAIAELERWSESTEALRWRAETMLARANYQVNSSDLTSALGSARGALAAFDRIDDAEGRLRSLTLAAEIHESRADNDAAREALREARAIAERFVSPAALLRVVRATGSVAFIARDFGAATAACTEALDLCARVGDVEGEAEVTSRMASIALRRFDVTAARAAYERATALYETLGNARALAAIRLNSAMVECAIGEPERALAWTDDAAARFAALDDLRGRSLAAANGAFCCVRLGRNDEAVRRAREAIALAELSANTTVRAHALANLALAQRCNGAYEAAIETFAIGLPLRRSTLSQVDLAEDLADLALSHLAVGRIDDALANVEEYLPNATALESESLFAHELLWTAAVVLAAAGDPRAAPTRARARVILVDRLARLPNDAARERFAAYANNPDILAIT